MDIGPMEAILLTLFLGIVVTAVVIPFLNELVTEIKAILHSMIPSMNNLWVYLIILLVISPLFYWRVFKNLEIKKQRRKEIQEKWEEIKEILDEDIKLLDSQELKDYIESLEELKSSKNSDVYKNDIEEKIQECEEHLEVLEREEARDEAESRAKEAEERFKLFNEELAKKKREMEQDKFKILLSLNPEENPVYNKNALSNKEIKILIEDGYSHYNEFCVYEQKRIPVLIKPVLSHSPSHTFLVWSAKRLLKKVDGAKYIEENLTREADITFMYEQEEYALEIETGNLLGKHEQLKDKLNYLNRKYPDKWMFIVSHRDLLSKYKKLGLTATRNNVLEKLEKLLKITHT